MSKLDPNFGHHPLTAQGGSAVCGTCHVALVVRSYIEVTEKDFERTAQRLQEEQD